MINFRLVHLAFFLFCRQLSFGQTSTSPAFHVVPLGVKGGITENNLSAYMVAPYKTTDYICLDAGTLHAGLKKAVKTKAFVTNPTVVLNKYLKGYLISHAHLDHVAGLILNSTEDSDKYIYGLAGTIEQIKQNYFNWQSWPNFGDSGTGYALKKYGYEILEPGGKENALKNTGMQVQAFALSHSPPYTSTAFLMHINGDYLLYVGDTGPDEVEKGKNLEVIWKHISSLIKQNKVRAIFIEVSYPNEQPDSQLYGHLTPRWLMKEMDALSTFTGVAPLKGLNLVITHIKPVGRNEKMIKQQLKEQNKLKFNLIFPEQGKPLNF